MLSFVGDIGCVGCGDSVGSVYAGCVDYEVRRREVGGRICRDVGEVDCILLYMICFGNELGIWELSGLVLGLGVSMLDMLGCLGMLGMLGECGAQA